MAAIVEQSVELLDRIQIALQHGKQYAMHLSMVADDVSGAIAILNRVKTNPRLGTEGVEASAKQLLGVASRLDPMVQQQAIDEAKGRGFRAFAHDFTKGPAEQKEMESLRCQLVAAKTSLILAIVAELSPSGTSLTVRHAKSSGVAIMQNGPIARSAADRNPDHVLVENVEAIEASVMVNTLVDQQQHDKHIDQQTQKFRLQQLTGLMQEPSVDSVLKIEIFNSIKLELGRLDRLA